MSPQARRDSQAAFMEGERRGGGGDERLRHGRRQGGRPHGRALGAADQPRGLLPGGRQGRTRRAPARALLLASRMDLGRLIRFIKERETSVEDVKRYVARPANARRRATPADDRPRRARRARSACCCPIAERAGARRAAARRSRRAARGAHRSRQPATGARRDPGVAQPRLGGIPLDRALQLTRTDLPQAPDPRALRRSEPQARPAGAAATYVTPTPRSSGRCSRRPRGHGKGLAEPLARARECRPGRSQRTISSRWTSAQFEELRAWRMERAEGKPAFTVASDATLRALLRERPRGTGALLEVKGIGPAFCEKHGRVAARGARGVGRRVGAASAQAR